MKKVVLVDGSSYLFRAFYALPKLISSEGEPTGAILGVINMIKKLPLIYQTDYVAMIFDPKGKTFRHDIYPDYKANRKIMDDELRVQIKPLYDIVKKMGFPLITKENVEADDIIGTLAIDLESQGYQVIISTGDKDMAQLVTDNIVLYDSMKNVTTGISKVVEKYKVKPSQIVDYLALMGDSSDNIPGIPKVGPKTAAKWLQEYQNIDELIANKDSIGGKVGENFRSNIETLRLSYRLATIKCDLDLNISIKDLKCKKADNESLAKIFSKYEFKYLLKNLDTDGESKSLVQPETLSVSYKTVTTFKELEKLIKILKNSKSFAFDTETNSLNTYEADLVGLSFCAKEGQAFYIPLQHRYPGAPQQLKLEVVLNLLKPIFLDIKKIKIAHNFKFDEKVLSKHNIEIEGNVHDTMIMAYILQSNTRHDMDSVSKKYLDINPISYSEIAGTGKDQQTLDQVEIQKVAQYAAEDADITFRLYSHMKTMFEKEDSLYKLYSQIEMPLTLILNEMEKIGTKIDADKLIQQGEKIKINIEELKSQCFEICSQEFNLSSPVQLRDILFKKMGLPMIKKTAKGHASTSEEVLVRLAQDYEVAALIIKYRHLSKLKNTYIDKLPQMLDRDSRVHTSYNQIGTITGRLSSSDPNLQNIPIKSLEGRKIREAFVAEKDSFIVAADYSQIELRIMAHLSNDKNLCKAFNEGLDVHNATAAEIFDVDVKDVTSGQRRKAKAVNFGLIYGMSAFGLARQLDVSRDKAQAYMDIYFSRYPGVKEYMIATKEFAKKNGFVETIAGRRLYLPEIYSSNIMQRNAAKRTAINAPMQGTAADIVKKAMIDVNLKIIKKYNHDVKMIMQVHDELIFEIKKNKMREVSDKIKDIMEQSLTLSVPLKVNIDFGNNWGQAH